MERADWRTVPTFYRASGPFWRLNLHSRGDELQGQLSEIDYSFLEIDLSRSFIQDMRGRSRSSNTALQDVFFDLAFAALRSLYRHIIANIYYFPAARSGILQSHKALASFLVKGRAMGGSGKGCTVA